MLFTTSLGHMVKMPESVLNCLSLEVQVPLPKELRQAIVTILIDQYLICEFLQLSHPQ